MRSCRASDPGRPFRAPSALTARSNRAWRQSYSGHMTARERLQLLVGGFGEEQAERALELLSPLVGADEALVEGDKSGFPVR